jgi:hypothetical protein
VHPLDLSDDRRATVLEAFHRLMLTIISDTRRRRHRITSLSRVHQRLFAPGLLGGHLHAPLC